MIKRFVGACIRGEEDEAVTQRQGNTGNGAVVEREEAEYKGSDGIGEEIIGEEAR